MSVASDALGDLAKPATGPLGGNLNNPRQQPEARRAPLNVKIDPATGMPGLHSSKPREFRDSAIPGRVSEPPWARMAAFMILARRTNSEIALAAGVDVTSVSNMRSQRWFQELIALLANEEGEAVTGAIAGYALEAVEGIAEIARTAEGERVRLQAYTTLLEHAKGKPKQSVEMNTTTRTYTSAAEEMADIQAELENLRAARAKVVEVPASQIETQTST